MCAPCAHPSRHFGGTQRHPAESPGAAAAVVAATAATAAADDHQRGKARAQRPMFGGGDACAEFGDEMVEIKTPRKTRRQVLLRFWSGADGVALPDALGVHRDHLAYATLGEGHESTGVHGMPAVVEVAASRRYDSSADLHQAGRITKRSLDSFAHRRIVETP